MVLSDSQICMRSIHLIMLFTPVGYMLMMCLTKCLSWLVGVWLWSCSTSAFASLFPCTFTDFKLSLHSEQ